MTIEVKQLLIKSNVCQDEGKEKDANDPNYDLEDMKSEIIEECRQLFVELLRKEQER